MAHSKEEVILKCRLKNCSAVVAHYGWLLDSYILDFFIENHINKLPQSWKQFLNAATLEDMHSILKSTKSEGKIVHPLSIICIKVLIHHLSISRHIDLNNGCSLVKSIKKNKLNFSDSCLDNNSLNILRHHKLWNLFLKHVKCKKRYEIFKMAEIIYKIAKRLNVCYVVDVGSGLGHLSRILAYGFQLKVCSIESNPQLTIQAKKLDQEFEMTASKVLGNVELSNFRNRSPIHINKTIQSDLTSSNFIKEIKTIFSTDGNDFKFGIIGLHPCGDLAAVLIKLYSDCPQAKFLNLAGCCYHKLTTALNSQSNVGFPLTEFTLKSCVNLSYESRALACHAIETYYERLKSGNYYHLKIHCYRAALEKIIDNNWPHYKKTGLSNVKASPNLDFEQYCQAALKKLNITVPEEDLNSEETLQNLSNWQKVVKYYSLRLMLAPLVETIILLDRQIYLLEKGIPCEFVTAFDPEISPRNQLLISEKAL